MEGSSTYATLDVGVIGAGIAGLASAIALRRAGHSVVVYERSSFKNEVGAAIIMPPQATRIMEAWDIPIPRRKSNKPQRNGNGNTESEESHGGTVLTRTRRVNFKTGQTFSQEIFDDIEERFGAPFLSYHRADLHTLLKVKAEELGAVIRLGSLVRGIDCQKGRITILGDDGPDQVSKHDLLVIADGINTSFIPQVLGHDVPLNRTGRTCFRTLIPMDKILADETARKVFEVPDGSILGHEGLSGTLNPQTGTFFLAYPCRNGKLMNVGVFDRPRSDRAERGDWNTPAAIKDALEPITDFGDGWKALLKCADSMKAFTIAEREPLPTYANGRTVLIGDAAHPMLPALAGGGSTSLEDAATLGLLFSDIPDSEAETISSRLELFNALRVPRDATQQVLSTAMFRPQPAINLKDRIQPFYAGELPKTMLGGWNKATCEFLCRYDVFHETQKAMIWAEESGWKDVHSLPPNLIQHFGTIVE